MDNQQLRYKTNESAELGCVAMALTARKFYDVISEIITAGDILTPTYRHIYEHCIIAYEQTSAPDAIAHAYTACGGNLEQRLALADIVASFSGGANAVRYALVVKESAIRRGVFQLAHDLPLRFDENTDAFTMLRFMDSYLKSLQPTNTAKSESLDSDISEHWMRSIETAAEKRARLVPSGIASLDELLDGGFEGGDLVVVGARPSVGKTAFGVTMFLNGVRNSYKVGFISLEMPKLQIIRRLISQISEIPMTVLKGATLNENQCTRLSMAHSELSELDGAGSVFIFDGNATLTQAKHAIQRFSAQGCKIIFIDYLQLIKPDINSKNRNREQEVAEVSRNLKGLAKEFNVIIVALAQLNKDADGKTPQMASMRESEAIIQDADYVLLLDRPEIRGMTFAEFLGADVPCIGKGFVYVRKARNGRTGAVILDYTADIGKFQDVEFNNSWE